MRLRLVRARAAVLSCFVLGACAVGPDFQRPTLPEHAGYLESPLPQQVPAKGDPTQQLRAGNDLANDWWTLYRCEPLNRYVAQALQDNPTLASASAALRQAQEQLAAGRGALWPGVNLQAGFSREQASGAALGFTSPSNTFNLYNAQVGVSYSFDLLGGIRRELEALQAQVGYQEHQLRAARIALTANIVTAVIRDVQLRDQVEALREVEKLQRAGLVVVERRFELGAVTRADVLSQKSALAQTVAQIAPLERQRAQTRHQLAVYAGRTPAEADLAALDLARLELPVDLPVSVPSDLVHERPDILAAEELLHAANAQVGVATAALYPQITLGLSYGSTALSAGDLFKPANAVWAASASVLQPLFRGGTLTAQRRAAVAARDQAEGAYRQTVLLAFANVADSLRALDLDAQALAADTDAYAQAKEAAELVQNQFDAGAASYLALLVAQQQYRQSAVAMVQARADRFADTAALFQAIGGGWWNAPAQGAGPAGAKPVASN